jgi:hypothetical protein
MMHHNMKAFVYSFEARQAYYSSVLATLTVDDLDKFVMNIRQ